MMIGRNWIVYLEYIKYLCFYKYTLYAWKMKQSIGTRFCEEPNWPWMWFGFRPILLVFFYGISAKWRHCTTLMLSTVQSNNSGDHQWNDSLLSVPTIMPGSVSGNDSSNINIKCNPTDMSDHMSPRFTLK